jgi:plastocyanin
MRCDRHAPGLAALAMGSLLLSACGAAAADDVSVRMRTEARYDPTVTAVPVGASVTWENDGGPAHTVTAIGEDGRPSGAFDSGPVIGTGRFTQRFDAPGAYLYHCEFHVDRGMVGVVVVTP